MAEQTRTNTLALEHRPQTWDALVGQPIAVKVITKSLELGDIKPGYVFYGTTGCGKSSAAYLLAKRLNCEMPDLETQDPCGACRSCEMIERGTSSDVKFVDGAADRSIAFVRETLKPFLTTVPLGKCRVAIIDEAHLYGKDAISAFLTLLENMPKFAGRSVVIMTTTEGDSIDAAVMNRCMGLPFSPIPNQVLASKMAEYTKQDERVLGILAESAGNSFWSMWSYIEIWQKLDVPLTEDIVMKLVGGVSTAERMAMWADISAKRIDKIRDRWNKWLQSGGRPGPVGDLLIKDLVNWAAAKPSSEDWRKPMLLLSGAQQVSSDSAWLQALYLMVGLPLEVHDGQRPDPEEGQPYLPTPAPAGITKPAPEPTWVASETALGIWEANVTDPVDERILFFGA